MLSLANESASNFSFVHPSSSVAPSAQLSLLSPRAPQIATPPLRAARRGSTTSNHSPTSALNARPSPNSVLHSRHSSGAMPDATYSPAGTTYSTSSHSTDAQPRRLYRPPHLRNRSSAHSLRPTVAHYDRVRTPSLRGQSRSPEPGLASSRSGSRPPSTMPLSPISNLSESMGGLDIVSRRRMGSIGSFSRLTSADTNKDQRPSDSLTLGDILATRLAQTGFEDSDIASSHPADLTIVGPTAPTSKHEDEEADDHEDEEADDVSLNAEDMMAMSERSITDRYCFSRDPSSSHAIPPVDIFEVGDRLGPGMLHDGQHIRIAETSDGFRAQSRDVTGSQLEVVRKLGEGSYATVYLVEEVAPLPLRELENEKAADFSNDKEYSGLSRSIPIRTSAPPQPQDPEDDTYSRTLRASDLVAEGRLRPREHADPLEHPVLGRQFALKCLCKRDLNEESLEIQRLEATIHQSIPPHPHIVTLYRTYETDDWLFLVLEYCPGQDLFYWLEQAHDQDTYNHEVPSSERSADGSYDLRVVTDELGGSSEESSFGHLDGTPPSPSLLASTAGQQLLSRSRADADARIIVKLTDFGLAVAQERCVDFDCGSKPYMAYECHNNVADWYDPMQADTWSLGIVLLNLLFHRSPFGEPSPQGDSAFASFCYDPVAFLTQAFEGLTVQVAEYMSDNVLCDVTNPKRDGSPRRRVTPQELGKWAQRLPEMLSADKREHGRSPGARTDLTSPLEHSRSPLDSGAASLFGSPWATPSGGPSLSIHESLDANGYGFYPSLFPEYPSNQDSSSFRDQRPQSVRTPSIIGTPESLPSPTFSPPRRTLRLPSVSEGSPLAREAASAANAARPRSPAAVPLKAAETADPGPQSPAESPESPEDSKSAVSKEVQSDELHSEKTDAAQAGHGQGAHDSNVESLRPVTASNPKRRKRGARKGRTAAKLEKQQHLKRSQSAENLASVPAQGEPHPRDALLAELAAASQTLAREMSRNVKKAQAGDALSAPQHTGTGRPSAARSTLASRAAQHLPPSLTDLAARPNPPMFLDKVVDSPGLDAASVYSSVGSRASTAYTNFSWNDRARPFSTLSTSTRMTDQSDSPAESQRDLAKDDASGSGAQRDSAAARRDRINAERGGDVASTSHKGSYAPFVEDARKSEPSSWRDRNPSTASVDTTSSASSLMSDAPSSIYSTTSAPAAILGSRRSTGSNKPPSRSLLGMTAGLDPIAERKRGEKAAEATAARFQPAMDASYLPAIFGANPKAAKPKERRKESGSNGRQPSSMTPQPHNSPSIDDRSGYAASFAPSVPSRLRPSQDSYTRPPSSRSALAPASSHSNANGSDVDRPVTTRGVSSVASTTAVTPMTTSASYSTPSFDATQPTPSASQNIVKSGMSRFFSVRNRNG
ncbi:kinase-like protein [Ceraceosorus bombacis]|uniref:Kinase-like protein n=1 Tax=Ceraceosorus bombacis TaxID=401625 RepID=A0A0P1BMB1_9BASI|nr:kinase-like protein [Ceraceosorus bombacis]